MLCCFQLYSHFFVKAPVTPAGPVSTILFLHGGELIATPGTHPLPQLWHLNCETLPGMIHQFIEYRFPFEKFTFAIFSWSLCHRGSKYLVIDGMDGLCNWRKFTASNSTLCTDQKYPLDGTYTSKKVTDNSEDDETGKRARHFFDQVKNNFSGANLNSVAKYYQTKIKSINTYDAEGDRIFKEWNLLNNNLYYENIEITSNLNIKILPNKSQYMPAETLLKFVTNDDVILFYIIEQ